MNPPSVLKPKHERAALLVATGLFTDKEVCEKLGKGAQWVAVLKQSPLFQEAVRRFSEKLSEQTVDAVVKIVSGDAPKNAQFITQVRDGDFDDDPKAMALRLRASEILFDRQYPRKSPTDVEQTVAIKFDKDAVERLERIAREVSAGTIDVTPQVPKDFDEFAAAFKDSEDDET